MKKQVDRLVKMKNLAEYKKKVGSNPVEVVLDDLFWMVEEIERLRKLVENIQMELM